MAGSVTASPRVIARNGIGRFISQVEAAGTILTERLVEEGAELSRQYAPVGTEVDPRTVPLKESIFHEMTGATSGRWYSVARHALAQEFGAPEHPIPGNPDLAFWWEAEGRWWIPAEQYYGVEGLPDVVNHPGNPPQPFLRPAYEQVMSKAMQIARQVYPG
jgi:hypothetical protein